MGHATCRAAHHIIERVTIRDQAAPSLITIVVPVLEEAAHCPNLLASLPASMRSLEVLFVIPAGGESESVRLWCARDPRGRMVHAPSPATPTLRRAGLELARGDWITFPQPDAHYGEGALTHLESLLHRWGEQLTVVALRTRREDGAKRRERGMDDGEWRFARGDRVVDLAADPEYVQTRLTSSVIRTSALRKHAALLTTAPTTAHDAMLIAAVMDDGADRRLGLAAKAQYVERYQTSPFEQFQQFRKTADNYLKRVSIARDLVRGEEPVPRWLAYAVIHELVSILRHEAATPRKAVSLDDEERSRFLTDAVFVARRVGVDALTAYSVGAMSGQLRALLRAWAGEMSPQLVRRTRIDRHSHSALVRYYFVGEHPSEAFVTSRGTHVGPQAQKVRAVDYFGQQIMRERIAWVHVDVSVVELDGVAHDLSAREDRLTVSQPRHSLSAQFRKARRTWLSRASVMRALARLPFAQRRFRGAWAFMDRADLAGDNAEHLYRWVSANHPEVNPWFILRQDSADWSRLETEGFRLVRYGSVAHQVLLNTAVEYLSSHAGVDVLRPRGDRLLSRNPRWRFTFLQHGVIHNDLSIWLNNQPIDLFVTTTHDEYAAIAGDGSAYVFTDREVKLTGMARFDELRRRSDERPWESRRTILVAPTWRNSLFLPAGRPGEPRRPIPGFEQSPYVQSLVRLLNDERLRGAAEAGGLEIVFLPHPNIGPHFPRHRVPDHVRVTSYAETNVQELLADARVFVTDYSSVAFDAAFAEAAVVYMQTDTGSVFGGDHTLHRGYFRFEDHGFGPVCYSVDAAVEAVGGALSSAVATRDYRRRARSTFAHWDANACERLVRILTAPRDISPRRG